MLHVGYFKMILYNLIYILADLTCVLQSSSSPFNVLVSHYRGVHGCLLFEGLDLAWGGTVAPTGLPGHDIAFQPPLECYLFRPVVTDSPRATGSFCASGDSHRHVMCLFCL